MMKGFLRVFAVLILGYNYHICRAQAPLEGSLSPVSYSQKQAAWIDFLKENQAVVLFSETGFQPSGHLNVHPVFRMITGLNKRFSVAVLLKEPKTFQEKTGQRFFFHSDQDLVGPEVLSATNVKDEDKYLSDFHVFGKENWQSFIEQLLAADTIKTVFTFPPAENSHLAGPNTSHDQMQQAFFGLLGGGEAFSHQGQYLLEKIRTATPTTFQAVVQEVNAALKYAPVLKENSLLTRAAKVTTYEEMEPLIAQTANLKIHVYKDAQAFVQATSQAGVAEELKLSRQLAEIATNSIKNKAKKVAPGTWTHHIEAQANLGMMQKGASWETSTSVFAGDQTGTIQANSPVQIQTNDWVTIEVRPHAGPYSVTAARSFPVGNATSTQKDLYNYVLQHHQYTLKNILPLTSMEPNPTMNGEKSTDNIRTILEKHDIKLTRTQRKNLFSAGGIHLAGPEIFYQTDTRLPKGSRVYIVQTSLFFPKQAGFSEKVAGWGVVLKDVVIVEAGKVTNLTGSVPTTLSEWATFRP